MQRYGDSQKATIPKNCDFIYQECGRCSQYLGNKRKKTIKENDLLEVKTDIYIQINTFCHIRVTKRRSYRTEECTIIILQLCSP